MIKEISGFNIYSETNPWIDFCIIPTSYCDFVLVQEIICKAYDEWFEPKEKWINDIPLATYIGMQLERNGIEFEMYFNDKEEDDE